MPYFIEGLHVIVTVCFVELSTLSSTLPDHTITVELMLGVSRRCRLDAEFFIYYF